MHAVLCCLALQLVANFTYFVSYGGVCVCTDREAYCAMGYCCNQQPWLAQEPEQAQEPELAWV